MIEIIGGGAKLLFDQSFPKNSMKMKEIRLRNGGILGSPTPRSANDNNFAITKENLKVFRN